jgi:hypothetical protein
MRTASSANAPPGVSAQAWSQASKKALLAWLSTAQSLVGQ